MTLPSLLEVITTVVYLKSRNRKTLSCIYVIVIEPLSIFTMVMGVDNDDTQLRILSMEKYEVVKDLGAGNFGVARLMRNKETKELVAMKYIERGHK
ncbi:hypothetical protein RIF29_23306 [Crotalaria pallida]|uniref:Protein kinase domain-containing protein n=1 Tax=Crotalaria pallida TaxID=3830 RepID=A0AAN9IF13_CROPI